MLDSQKNHKIGRCNIVGISGDPTNEEHNWSISLYVRTDSSRPGAAAMGSNMLKKLRLRIRNRPDPDPYKKGRIVFKEKELRMICLVRSGFGMWIPDFLDMLGSGSTPAGSAARGGVYGCNVPIRSNESMELGHVNARKVLTKSAKTKQF